MALGEAGRNETELGKVILAAKLVPAPQHTMAFGTLAAVNAVDSASSLMVGLFCTTYSSSAAFAVAGTLFMVGAVLILRLH